MTLKSLLFGSAAIIAAGTGAQAADLPTAEPVEYVRICDAFGTGFYYIPGTDTCLKVGGQVRAEAHWVDTGDDDDDDDDDGFDPVGDGFLTGGDNPDLNNFTTRARGNVRLDARTQTDFGLVRAFIDLEMTVGPTNASSTSTFPDPFDESSDESSSAGSANYSSTGPNLAAAFIQITNDWGTFTAGHTGSFFDFFGSYDFGTRLDIDDNTTEQTLFAYTFGAGNGFSFTVSAEDPASSGRRLNPSFPAALAGVDLDGDGAADDFIVVAGGTDDYEGQEAPDGVFNIRVDQGWGSAQVMAVVGQIHDKNGDGGDLFGRRSDDNDGIGWAVGAGLSTKIPFLGGLELSAQGGYAEGRLGYISTDRGGFGDFTGFEGDDTTQGWNIRGGIRYGFTSTVTGSVSGSFTHVERDDIDFSDTPGLGGIGELDILPDEYEFFAINANVVWTPVEGLSMGPEVAYQSIDFSDDGDDDDDDFDADGDDSAWGAMFRIQRAF